MNRTSALLALVLFCLLPWGVGTYLQHVLIVGLFYVMMATSWNLIAGYTGQVSFGHAAFAGIGAYASGLLAAKAGFPAWTGVLIGAALAAGCGALVGLLCLRMGGIYLSLTTLGFSEILHLILVNEYELTRGTMGLQVPGLFPVYSKIVWYYVMLAGALFCLAVVYLLVSGNTGLRFRAVRNDERAAASLGVDVTRVRLLAFTVSSALAGLAGALFGHYLMLITPHLASLDTQFLVLAMTVIGGLGSFAGPVAGALALELLSESIRVYGEYHLLAFGLVALVTARFAPKGLAGLLASLKDRVAARVAAGGAS